MGSQGRAHDLDGSIVSGAAVHGSLLGRGSIVSVQQTTVNTGTDADPSHECVFTVEVALDGARGTPPPAVSRSARLRSCR